MSTVAELATFGSHVVRLRRWLGITAGDTTHDAELEDYWTAATGQADGILGRDDWDALPRPVVVALLQATRVYWESRDALEAQRNKLVEYAATAERARMAMLPLLLAYQSAGAL